MVRSPRAPSSCSTPCSSPRSASQHGNRSADAGHVGPLAQDVGGFSIRLIPLMDPEYRRLSRRIPWLAADSAGTLVESAFLRLNSPQEQAHLAEFELNSHPAERRR